MTQIFPCSGKQLLEVAISRTMKVYFTGMIYRIPVKLNGHGGSMRINMHVPQYLSRVDTENWPIVKHPNDCSREPREFHACIFAASSLLRHSGQEKLVYDGEADPTVSVRNVIQRVADVYQCDPSALANQYPRVRQWIGHRGLARPLPLTFDELENGLKMAGDTNIRLH